MLFLTEQDVKAALAGRDAYKEAVGVIERVLEQHAGRGSARAPCAKGRAVPNVIVGWPVRV